jgi:outer membrane protein assembly factor BamA
VNYSVERQYLDRLQEYEDLYFSHYVTPVRGAPYFSLVGNHFSAFNAEFRFPFIEYMVLKWPISAVFGNVRGLMFADYVRVWDDDDLSNRSTTEILFRDDDNSYFGSGLGLRVNLGIFVLRYDLAYDMSIKPRFSEPQHIWSLGLDF